MKERDGPSPEHRSFRIPLKADLAPRNIESDAGNQEQQEKMTMDTLRELETWLINSDLSPELAEECIGSIGGYYQEILIPKLEVVTVAITGKDWGGNCSGVRLRLLWPAQFEMAETKTLEIMREIKQAFRDDIEDRLFPQVIMQLSIYTPNGRERPFTESVREWGRANSVDYFGILSTNNEDTLSGKLLTSTEAAARLGVVRQRIHQLVVEGKLSPAREQRIGLGDSVSRLFNARDVEKIRQEQIARLQDKFSRLVSP